MTDETATPEFYVDSAKLSASPSDLVMDCGLVSPDDQGLPASQRAIKRLVRVRMSLHNARMPAAALAQTVDSYEREIVAIPMAPDESWYFSPGWQAAEAEADRCIAQGDFADFDNAERFVGSLK